MVDRTKLTSFKIFVLFSQSFFFRLKNQSKGMHQNSYFPLNSFKNRVLVDQSKLNS